MTRPLTAALALLVASGCTSRAEEAERQYDVAKRAGLGAAELCAKGRAMADAYLQTADELTYQLKKVRADIDCTQAEMDERAGIVRDAAGNIVPSDVEAMDPLAGPANAAAPGP